MRTRVGSGTSSPAAKAETGLLPLSPGFLPHFHTVDSHPPTTQCYMLMDQGPLHTHLPLTIMLTYTALYKELLSLSHFIFTSTLISYSGPVIITLIF